MQGEGWGDGTKDVFWGRFGRAVNPSCLIHTNLGVNVSGERDVNGAVGLEHVSVLLE